MLNRQHLTTLLLVWVVLVLLTSYGNTEPQGALVTETYIVRPGDTLDEISYRFMEKSAVRRDVREFREGIIELNWETVFKDRKPYGLLMPGDRLQINYWTSAKQNEKAAATNSDPLREKLNSIT